MHCVAVDDERPALDYLLRLIGEDGGNTAAGFTDPLEALSYIESHGADVAFLDVEMYGLSGIELAKKIKDVRPETSIIFVTGFSQYAVEAFSVRACGYLLKPPTREAIQAEIALVKSRQPMTVKKRVYAQTFGSFEIFCDGTPVKFGRTKAKELLAYLVDRRGAGVSTQELIGILFEDREAGASVSSLIRILISDMLHSLKNVGAEDVVIKSRNNLSLDVSKIDCDYYAFLAGDTRAINSYAGEYMANYSWAEFTTGFLDEKTDRY